MDGSDLAGWGIAAVSPDNFVQILCGPVLCGPRHLAFLGATSCSVNKAELTCLAEARRWICFFIPRGEKVRFLFRFKARGSCYLGVDHARRNITSACQCNELLLRSKCLFSRSRFIMFLAMRVMPGLGALPHPFQPNVYAQRSWQETRRTGVPPPLGSATCMAPGCNHDTGVHDCYCSQGWCSSADDGDN